MLLFNSDPEPSENCSKPIINKHSSRGMAMVPTERTQYRNDGEMMKNSQKRSLSVSNFVALNVRLQPRTRLKIGKGPSSPCSKLQVAEKGERLPHNAFPFSFAHRGPERGSAARHT